MISKWNADFLLHNICAYLSALGLELFTLSMMGLSLEFTWITTAIVCAVSIFFLVLMTYRFSIVLILLTGLSIPVIFLAIFTDALYAVYEYTNRFILWLGPFLMGSGTHNANFELTLYVSVISIISLLCFVFACLLDSALFLLLLSIIPIISMSILSKEKLPYALLLPTVFGIIFLFSLTAKTVIHRETAEVYSQRGYLHTLLAILPVIFIGLLVSFSISYSYPAESLRSDEVTDSTNDILSALHLPLPSTTNRNAFNLGGLGYYPLHSRLGGPVSILNIRVMEVTSSNDLLLRAATYDKYERIFWSCSSSLFSSRFHSNILTDQTQNFFDMNRPDASKIPEELYSAVIEKEEVTIKNLNAQTGSTLFAADHLLDISNNKYEVYYNQSSEIFQNRSVDPGQTYTLTVSHFKVSSPNYMNKLLALESYIIAHPEAADSAGRIKSIRDGYLPVTAPDSVVNYALSLTTDDQTPLQKVFAIRQNLLTRFTYSLDVEVPPEDSDFVEFFLSTKTGYCTYFASAMAVMAKINGIPARYVEGFVVNVPETSFADSPEDVTVTGKNGHAWCEVYIDGIGWIPIDATASSIPGGPALSELGFSDAPAPSAAPAYVPPDEGYVPDHDTIDPTGLQGNSDSFLTMLSAVMQVVILPLLFAAILTITVSLVFFRRRWNRKFALTSLSSIRAEYSPEAAVSYLHQRSMNHLSLLSIKIEPTETVSDLAVRLQSIPVYISGCHKDTYRFEAGHIAGIYDTLLYGRHLPTDEELNAAYFECLKLISDVRNAHNSKVSYYLHFLKKPKK